MKPKILVVDDEENMLLLLQRSLGKEGYRIFTAPSGEEGLKLARKHSFRLAIVDQRMPNLDGIDLIRKLREMHKEMPVIAVTAFPSWEGEQKARSLGCVDYLPKPLDLKLLKDIVRKYVST